MTSILYILSSGHSGSTVLGSVLGSNPGIEMVGELDRLPSVGMRKNCTCGQTLRACRVWGPLLEELGVGRRDELASSRQEIDETSVMSKVLATYGSSDWIVDSSKRVGRLRRLRSYGFNVVPLWLVRDGRSVAVSKQNAMLRKGATTVPSLRSLSKAWFDEQETIREALSLFSSDTLPIRFEDFLVDNGEVRRNLELTLGCELGAFDAEVDLSTQHHVDGNRLRNAKTLTPNADHYLDTTLGKNQNWTPAIRARRLMGQLGYI